MRKTIFDDRYQYTILKDGEAVAVDDPGNALVIGKVLMSREKVKYQMPVETFIKNATEAGREKIL